MIIADNAAELVNIIFASDSYTGSRLAVGAVLFAFQIYGDFSGYSDIAIGVSKLFGIKLMTNFSYPYFSRDMAEFWRRWHISLSTWFRDYLYIPLGGSHGGMAIKIRNTFIIFIVSGFWHGANWTFIIWGFLNALYFLPLLLFNKNRTNILIAASTSNFPSIKEVIQIITTFFFTVIAWVFFRSPSVFYAFDYLSRMFSKSLFTIPKLEHGLQNTNLILIVLFIGILVLVEWFHRRNEFVFEKLHLTNIYFQLGIIICFTALFFLFTGNQQDFIYFQF